MFIITNRRVDDDPKVKGFKKIGDKPNPKGPNELRLVEAIKSSRGWKITILPDKVDDSMMKKASLTPNVAPDGTILPVYASQYAATQVLRVANPRKKGVKGKNVLFFVHGFNNDFEAVLERMYGFAKTYGVEVIGFSWPANGGGIRGALSYKSDKRDARASIGALDRCLAKMYKYLNEYRKEFIDDKIKEICKKYPRNAERRDDLITKLSNQKCPFKITLVLHSMGNYLYKHLLKSSVYRGHHLLFDNVVLVAADTNNKEHAQWIDKIQCRNRTYITINENDSALGASRIKAGEEQLARLGHYPYKLNSQQAVYVDFTDAPRVKKSHAYFEGSAVKNKSNTAVKTFFHRAFNGELAETDVCYHASSNLYKFHKSK